MAAIRSKNSKAELTVRRGLHSLGHRYRLGWKYKVRGKYLPGKPDLVLPSRQAVVFVNGCFWHGHGCHLFKWPKTEAEFWREKILGNISRDQRAREQLRSEGWRIADVWECTLKGVERWPAGEVVAELDRFIRSDLERLVIGWAVTVSEGA